MLVAMIRTGSKTILPRVADLERSVQWTSLANDIHNLERRRDVSGVRPVARTIERHTYHRGSMPEMQRACTVLCDDDRDALSQRDSYVEPENSRWSWKPRTDFEREYFYKDYKDYYGDSGAARFEPAVCEISAGDRSYLQEEARTYGSPVARFSSATRRRPIGLEKEHFSNSRDRLHEIFEHNRYLRRQFFADTSGNASRNPNGLHSKNFNRSNQTSRHCTGFGSTETLTSQSNQSSMSSINDRKSRTQTTRTPEEEEEEDALVEFARRNNVVPHRKFNNSSQENDNDARKDGKVLVNILSGTEIRHIDVRNVPAVNPEETSNERNEGSPIVEVARDATCEQRILDNQCREDETDLGTWHGKRNLPEYIFGGDTKIGSRRDETLPSNRRNKNGYHCDARDESERDWNRFSQNEICPWTILENERLNRNVASRNDGRMRQDLCKSLPNLTVRKQNLDAPLYVARAVNVPEERSASDDYTLDSHIVGSGHGSGQCREQRSGRREGPTRSIGRGQSISEATTVSLKRLTSRSKIGKVPPPPPLDLSMVNEQCERMEADERRYLNDYSVDVAILRSHEDLVKDLLTVAENKRDRVVGNITRIDDVGPSRSDQFCGRNDGRRPSFLRKSCGDLSLADDLRSPQLVNDCRNFTGDPRMTVDPVRRPIDPDASRRDRRASPLFDQTSPIGGLYAAGSTLPSTVYGPIPYSQ